MFGKKKDGQGTKDFRCAECGVDCHDEEHLGRHLTWAHPALAASKTRSGPDLKVTDKKV